MKKILLIIFLFLFGICAAYLLGAYSAAPRSETRPEVAAKYEILNADKWRPFPLKMEDSPSDRGGYRWDVTTKSGQIIVEGGGGNGFFCNSKKVDVVLYSSYSVSNAIPGGSSRSIIDCGSYYFVLESVGFPQYLYGPFQLTNN